MKIQLYGLVEESIVDGEGLRMAIFTQGCPHHCEGCHNPESHSLTGGMIWDVGDIIAKIKKNPLLDGITLSGGEPFLQPSACLELAKAAHDLGLSVWCYTGFTYKQLIAQDCEETKPLLHEIDVLVDGRFVLSQRSLDLYFKGSKNQRTIDIKATERAGRITLYHK